ncbi:MAG: hypothetical protein ACI4GV_01680 [Acutalibacteraceae bacterium]
MKDDIMFDSDPYWSVIFSSQCYSCVHCNDDYLSHKCSDYPDGIPPEIWLSEVKHDKPYKQQNNIIYKKNEI